MRCVRRRSAALSPAGPVVEDFTSAIGSPVVHRYSRPTSGHRASRGSRDSLHRLTRFEITLEYTYSGQTLRGHPVPTKQSDWESQFTTPAQESSVSRKKYQILFLYTLLPIRTRSASFRLSLNRAKYARPHKSESDTSASRGDRHAARASGDASSERSPRRRGVSQRNCAFDRYQSQFELHESRRPQPALRHPRRGGPRQHGQCVQGAGPGDRRDRRVETLEARDRFGSGHDGAVQERTALRAKNHSQERLPRPRFQPHRRPRLHFDGVRRRREPALRHEPLRRPAGAQSDWRGVADLLRAERSARARYRSP